MVAMVTFRMQDVVLGWQMLEATDSAFWVGLVAFAHNLPLLIWSPITGMWADRPKRRQMIAAALLLSAVTSAVLALVLAFGHASPWHIIALSFLVGSAFALYAPARLALLPNLIPTHVLPRASAFEYSSTRLMGFFGPMVAGVLVDVLDVAPTLFIQAVMFALAAAIFVCSGKMDGSRAHQGSQAHMLSGLREAVVYLGQDRPLLALTCLGLVMVPIGMSYQKLMPVFTQDVLGAGASTLGLLLGAVSLGAALAGFAVAATENTFSQGRTLLLSAALFSGGLIVFAFCSQVILAVILLFVMGLIAGVYLTLSNVLFQSRAPDRVRGRILSIWGMIWGLLPFASLAMGAAAERWNVQLAIGASGAICVIFSVGMALTSSALQEI
jgi:MFS family permease